MLHTKNNDYRLVYVKGHCGYSNGSKYWIRTKWTVKKMFSDTPVWEHEGSLNNDQKQELFNKFNLSVKTN